MKCENCSHAEMCKWIDELGGRGCDFFDGEQEPTKREIEREYLFQSLCEDFKKLQAENDDLRKRLEQEPITTTNNNEPMTMVYPTIVCDDAISREYLKKIAQSEGAYGYVSAHDIATAPSVTQKSGKWIIIDDCEKFIAKCSECGRIEDSRMIGKYPYCHCGAKMVEPQESEE